jgi:hypothetical protein
MPYYDDEATDEAAKAHHRWCVRNGCGTTHDQPNRHDSERVGDVVYLRNGNRTLARYRVLEDSRVRRIRALVEA